MVALTFLVFVIGNDSTPLVLRSRRSIRTMGSEGWSSVCPTLSGKRIKQNIHFTKLDIFFEFIISVKNFIPNFSDP